MFENDEPGTFSLYCNLTKEYEDNGGDQQNVVLVVLTGVAVTAVTLSQAAAVVNVPPECQLTVGALQYQSLKSYS